MFFNISSQKNEDLNSRIKKFHHRQRRYNRYSILMLFTFIYSGFVLYGFRGDMYYAFFASKKPYELGSIANHSPKDIPHNAYVSLNGITEHRGLKQLSIRGLSLNRQELWYFRLLGSQGVFIEVPADSGIGITEKVDIKGRALDPKRINGFKALLQTYHEDFIVAEGDEYRIIQVDFLPQQGKVYFILIFIFWSILLISNFWALTNFMRLRYMLIQKKKSK